MRFIIINYFLAFFLLHPLSALAESSLPTDSEKLLEIKEQNKNLKKMLDKAIFDVEQLRSELSKRPKTENQKLVMQGYHDSWIDLYKHEKYLREHTKDVLSWQKFAAYIVLSLVVLVTTLGIYLSFVEVKAALSISKKKFSDTNVEISLQKLQVTSAITGVVILIISLAFLFLFLDRVFELDPHDYNVNKMPETEKITQGDKTN